MASGNTTGPAPRRGLSDPAVCKATGVGLAPMPCAWWTIPDPTSTFFRSTADTFARIRSAQALLPEPRKGPLQAPAA